MHCPYDRVESDEIPSSKKLFAFPAISSFEMFLDANLEEVYLIAFGEGKADSQVKEMEEV